MKSKNKIVCALVAFWPFVLIVIAGNILGFFGWFAPVDGDTVSAGWRSTGALFNIVTAAAVAGISITYLIQWCEGNYRECIGLPRVRNKEEGEKYPMDH